MQIWRDDHLCLEIYASEQAREFEQQKPSLEALGHVAKHILEGIGDLYSLSNVSAIILSRVWGYKGKSPHELLTAMRHNPTAKPMTLEELAAKKIAESAIIASTVMKSKDG